MGRRIREWICGILVSSLLFSQAAYGQTTQQQVGRLVDQVESLRTRVDELETNQRALLQELLATQKTDRVVSQGVPTPTAVDASKATASAAEKVLMDLKAKSPKSLGMSADGTTPLIDTMLKCIEPVVATNQVPDAAAGAALVSQCDAQEIVAQLENNRQRALEAWNRCRAVLLSGKKVYEEHLPPSPVSTSTADRETIKKSLASLRGLTDDALSCKDQLASIVDDVKNMDDSASAMAAVMSMAGTICMASGANPYVCGPAFVLAFLMQMFGSGNGDGDGDGKSGTGDGKGYGDVAGSASSKGEAKTPPVVPAPPKLGGSFGDVANGPLRCEVVSGPRLACVLSRTNEKTTINPSNVVGPNASGEQFLRDALNRNDPRNIGFCMTPAPVERISRLVLIDGSKYYSVGIAPDLLSPGESSVNFSRTNDIPVAAAGKTGQALKDHLCGHTG